MRNKIKWVRGSYCYDWNCCIYSRGQPVPHPLCTHHQTCINTCLCTAVVSLMHHTTWGFPARRVQTDEGYMVLLSKGRYVTLRVVTNETFEIRKDGALDPPVPTLRCSNRNTTSSVIGSSPGDTRLGIRRQQSRGGSRTTHTKEARSARRPTAVDRCTVQPL